MARGGVYDQLAGGFHRYSVDERWVVPHFEKIIYDNTELLRNYVHAYQSLVREDFRSTAEEIIGWLDAVMTDRERGGFYASQDADFSLDDDGDYFTWTRDEAAEVLTADELALATVFYDIGGIGDMHHNVAKNLLHIKHPLEVAARRAGVPADSAPARLASIRCPQTPAASRSTPPTPPARSTSPLLTVNRLTRFRNPPPGTPLSFPATGFSLPSAPTPSASAPLPSAASNPVRPSRRSPRRLPPPAFASSM